MARSVGKIGFVAGCTSAALLLASPVSALAADRFVDKDTGSDAAGANTCSSSVAPCLTIQQAIGQAGGNDTVKVDDSSGLYGETALLTNGISLAGAEFVGGDEGDVIIDNGANLAVQVPGGASAGTISGLTLRSTLTAVRLQGDTVAVTGNVFNSGGASQVDLDVQTGSPTISENTFSDLNTTVLDKGIVVNGASPTIIDNLFNQLNIPIEVGGGSDASNTRIEENSISGVHASGVNGFGISVARSTNVLIEDNVVSGPIGASLNGISVTSGGLPTSATLRRNQVYGFGNGVLFDETTLASMHGDVVAGSTQVGVHALDFGGGGGDLSAKNITVVSDATATADFQVSAQLTLDSSIVSDEGIQVSGSGSCAITRSRGPTMTPGAPGCADFQTTATPNFINPAVNNYHLTAANAALIDQGDPAAPVAPDNLDYDLQKRNIDGDENCSEIRDIGADEFLPLSVPPMATITGGPANGSTITTASTSFSFTNSHPCPGAGFECSLDGAAFSGCTSPANLSGLEEGAHTFAVRALDLLPQAGSPDSRGFTVDLPDPPATPPASNPAPTATTPTAAPKKCKKGRKLKKGKCVKKKKRKK